MQGGVGKCVFVLTVALLVDRSQSTTDIQFECSSVSCKAGDQPNSDQSGCELCPRGTYQPTAGEAECIKCSPGKSTAEEGAQNDDQCKDVEVPSNTTLIIGGSVGGLLLLLLLSCIVYIVYRRRSGPTKDAPDPQAGQHHGSGDNPTPALRQTCRTTSDICEEIDDERTVSVWPQTGHNNRRIVATSGGKRRNVAASSLVQRLNIAVSPNPHTDGYGMTNQPVVEYQTLSSSDRVPVVPKVYASLGAILPQAQSNTVSSPRSHSDANIDESEMTNLPTT